MLKRMWEGDLSLDDKQRINTRVIGYNGLELPSILQGPIEEKIKLSSVVCRLSSVVCRLSSVGVGVVRV